MAELGHLTCKRKKEEVIVKCVTSLEYPVYEKTFCLCIAQDEEPYNHREWYMLKISSEKDKAEEAEEKLGKKICQITDAAPGSLSSVSPRRPPPSASVGSFVYHIGRYCGEGKYSRNVRYFDSSHPEEGPKTGPRTICARCDAAVVGLNGNLYVMGFDGSGANLDIPTMWGEFLDTRLVGEGHAEWSALPDSPSTLGSKYLFAATLGSDFSGKILVLNQ
ncbi:hypothetical protein RHGRI_031301 [Rhododendron griersonianum]|uniref:Uncharacterized protein n=1 Tax=Rhododendron griersonianum TaxID=479676 RepID=A0AAV6I7S8_9ERIC|nr:hypothetical protein RHGRI_031301 [Rhododendron griersonianum]